MHHPQPSATSEVSLTGASQAESNLDTVLAFTLHLQTNSYIQASDKFLLSSSDHGSGARYWLITHTARVRFPFKTSGFFQITTIFRRRCKAVGPGHLLSNGRWVMLEALARPENF
jgi:hypothetical protein